MPPAPRELRHRRRASSTKRKQSPSEDAVITTSPKWRDDYTWKEVAQHNSDNDAWVIHDGMVYDITEFVDKHPGGKEMMALCAGRDVTELVQMYHPFSKMPERVLKSMAIGKVVDNEFPIYKKDSGFYEEASARVAEYFKKTGYHPRDARYGIMRMIPVYAFYFTAFAIMCGAFNATLPVKICAALFFGVCQVMPLLHFMHDSSHAAIGEKEGVWRFLGRMSMDFLTGGSMFSWHHQHVMGHHLYTNVYGADPDVPPSGDVRRVTEDQEYDAKYKWQWLYLPIVYGLLTMKVRVDDIFTIWASGMNSWIRVNYYDAWPTFRTFSSKVFWVTWRFGVPLYLFQQSAAEMFLLFFINEMSGGYWLAWNFQVSHISEGAEFPSMQDGKSVLNTEWAVAQVTTGVDWGHGNWWGTFLSGALNYQIPHHLFPGVSQYHYPAITPIIMEVAKKYNIPYRVEPTFWSAWTAHVRQLYNMGLRGEKAEMAHF